MKMTVHNWFAKLPTYETMQPQRAADWVIMESRKKQQKRREEGAFCLGYIVGGLMSSAVAIALHSMGIF